MNVLLGVNNAWHICNVVWKGVLFMDLKEKIRIIEDFPKPGISFKDITTLLQDQRAFKYSVKKMAKFCQERSVDIIVG